MCKNVMKYLIFSAELEVEATLGSEEEATKAPEVLGGVQG